MPRRGRNLNNAGYDAVGKLKRKKVTAQTVFQREFKQSHAHFSNCCMSDIGLIRAAQDAYDKLSLDERQIYEAKAKQETKKLDEEADYLFRSDNIGESYSKQLAAERKRTDFMDYMLTSIKFMINSHNKVTNEIFIVGEVLNHLNVTEANGYDCYLPAEIGLVKFSLSRGVISCHHVILGDIIVPTGYSAAVKINCHDTHQIPIDTKGSVSSYIQVVQELEAFCRKGDDPDNFHYLFVPQKKVLDMQKALLYIYGRLDRKTTPFVMEINTAHKSNVFTVEELISSLSNNTDVLPGNKCANLHVAQITDNLTRNMHHNTNMYKCDFHRDILDFCAKHLAHVYVWHLLSLLSEKYDYVLTANHIPETEEVKPVAQKSNWFSEPIKPCSLYGPGRLAFGDENNDSCGDRKISAFKPRGPPSTITEVSEGSSSVASVNSGSTLIGRGRGILGIISSQSSLLDESPCKLPVNDDLSDQLDDVIDEKFIHDAVEAPVVLVPKGRGRGRGVLKAMLEKTSGPSGRVDLSDAAPLNSGRGRGKPKFKFNCEVVD